MTTPAVTALKQKYPGAQISYVIGEPYLDLVQGNTCLDEIIVLPSKHGRRDFFKFLRQIRKSRYDVVVDFHGGPRASWITLFSKARLKIGYKIKYKHFIYDIKIPRRLEEGFVHSVENHVNLVRTIGVSPDVIPRLSLPATTESEKANVDKFIQENQLGDTQIIVFHIGAGNRFRDWGLDNMSGLIHLLSQEPNVAVVLIGGEEDSKAERALLDSSSYSLFSLVNKMGLREIKEVISRAALFVGPDSGPMHIAASTSTPIVAYFGPTLPAVFAPWMAESALIEKDFTCRPCKQVECIHDDFRCLQTITPEEVYQACKTILRKRLCGT